MAITKKVVKTRSTKKGGYRKKRGFKKAKDVPEFASLSVGSTLTPHGATAYNLNTLYSQMDTQLINFNRATQVAGAYQHFRMKKITMTFKPAFDSYIASGGSQSKPSLYWLIDKSGSVPTNISLEGMKQMGCKPIAFDEKPIKISWRPSVLQSVMYAAGINAATPNKYLVSPWLSTVGVPVQPNSLGGSNGTDHLGLYWYMDCLTNPIGAQYQVEIEVQFQFKKPLIYGLTSDIPAAPSVKATINTSPDGVVGGGDGY